jgi:hypothetical protein
MNQKSNRFNGLQLRSSAISPGIREGNCKKSEKPTAENTSIVLFEKPNCFDPSEGAFIVKCAFMPIEKPTLRGPIMAEGLISGIMNYRPLVPIRLYYLLLLSSAPGHPFAASC